jgi:hypothetical protein
LEIGDKIISGVIIMMKTSKKDVQTDKKRGKKPYIKPAVILELDLETRAGTPLSDPLDGVDPLDLTGTGQSVP